MVAIQIVSLAVTCLNCQGRARSSWLAADKKHICNYSFGMFKEQSVHAPYAFDFTLFVSPFPPFPPYVSILPVT